MADRNSHFAPNLTNVMRNKLWVALFLVVGLLLTAKQAYSTPHTFWSAPERNITDYVSLTDLGDGSFEIRGEGQVIQLVPYSVNSLNLKDNLITDENTTINKQLLTAKDKYEFGMVVNFTPTKKSTIKEIGWDIIGGKGITYDSDGFYFGDDKNPRDIYVNFSDIRKFGFDITVSDKDIKITNLVGEELNLDPTITFSTASITSVATTPLGVDSFVMAYCDDTNDDISFIVYNTSGAVITGETDADTTAGGCNYQSVSVSAFNSTDFVIGWWDSGDSDTTFSIYNSGGTLKSGPTDADTNSGNAYSVSVSTFNSTDFVIGWFNKASTDIYFAIYNSGSTAKVAATKVSDTDGAIGDTSQASVSTFNSTDFVIGWNLETQGTYFAIYNSAGTNKVAATQVSSTSGVAHSVSVATFNSTDLVISWFDNTQYDTTFSIYNSGGTLKSGPTDADTDVAINAYTNIGLSVFNSTNFVMGWFDDTDDDVTFSTYNYGSTLVAGPTDVTTSSTLKYVSTASRNQVRNISLCNNNFAIAYLNSSSVAIWETYNANGTAWDGICPILNSPPTVTTPILSPIPAYKTTDLTANTTYTDPDGNVGTVTFSWFDNNALIFTHTFASVASGTVVNATLGYGNFSKNNLINVTVNASDTSATASSTLTSAGLNISNSAPAWTQVPTQFSLYHSQNLTGQLNATDADSDALTWGVNTSMIGVSSSGLLFDNATQVEVGNYSIKVNVTDGWDWVSMVWTYEIMNQGPVWAQTISAVSLSHAQDLNITLNATDADGDSLIYYINTTMLNIASNKVSDNPSQAETGIYSVRLNATDGWDWISMIWIYEITNTQPVFTQQAVNISIYHDQTFGVQLNATDGEGDTITWADNSSLTVINASGWLSNTSVGYPNRGRHAIRITINDSLNISASDFYLQIDTYYPAVNVFSLNASGIFLGATFALAANITDRDDNISVVTYYVKRPNLDIVSGFLVFNNITGLYEGTYSNTATPGEYYLQNVSVNDSLNLITWANYGTSMPVSLYTDPSLVKSGSPGGPGGPGVTYTIVTGNITVVNTSFEVGQNPIDVYMITLPFKARVQIRHFHESANHIIKSCTSSFEDAKCEIVDQNNMVFSMAFDTDTETELSIIKTTQFKITAADGSVLDVPYTVRAINLAGYMETRTMDLPLKSELFFKLDSDDMVIGIRYPTFILLAALVFLMILAMMNIYHALKR